MSELKADTPAASSTQIVFTMMTLWAFWEAVRGWWGDRSDQDLRLAAQKAFWAFVDAVDTALED